MPVEEADLEAVDRFLADPDKVLDGIQPLWQFAPGYEEYQLSWPIIEQTTGIIRAALRFRVPGNDIHFPSISVIFRGRPVCRLDRARPAVCEPNPPLAQRRGLPAWVCGVHVHRWEDNRPLILLEDRWHLAARAPVEDRLNHLEHMFLWLCGHAGVRIQPGNRPLTLPDVGLFGGGDA